MVGRVVPGWWEKGEVGRTRTPEERNGKVVVGWPVDEKRCVKEKKELEACMEEEKMKDEGEN